MQFTYLYCLVYKIVNIFWHSSNMVMKVCGFEFWVGSSFWDRFTSLLTRASTLKWTTVTFLCPPRLQLMSFMSNYLSEHLHNFIILFLTENSNKMQQFIKILLFLIFSEAQHVSGDTPPIIRSLKLHKQPLGLRMWKVVGRAVVGCCQEAYASWRQLHVRQPSTYAKPEAGCAVLGSWWWVVCHPKYVELHLK